MSEQEQTIMTTRESWLSIGFWMKLLFTIGFYFFWWLGKKLVVTNRRVYYKTGLLGGNERSIPLNRVTDISVSRGVFGAVLGYGSIRIESAGGGGTEIVASGIRGPKDVQDAILRQVG